MEFKDNLKKVRKKKKITQRQLAEMLGKNQVTIARYETGDIIPPIKVIEEIAKALNISKWELLNEHDSPYNDFINLYGLKEVNETNLGEKIFIEYLKLEMEFEKRLIEFLERHNTLLKRERTKEEIETLANQIMDYIQYLETKFKK